MEDSRGTERRDEERGNLRETLPTHTPSPHPPLLPSPLPLLPSGGVGGREDIENDVDTKQDSMLM